MGVTNQWALIMEEKFFEYESEKIHLPPFTSFKPHHGYRYLLGVMYITVEVYTMEFGTN